MCETETRSLLCVWRGINGRKHIQCNCQLTMIRVFQIIQRDRGKSKKLGTMTKLQSVGKIFIHRHHRGLEIKLKGFPSGEKVLVGGSELEIIVLGGRRFVSIASPTPRTNKMIIQITLSLAVAIKPTCLPLRFSVGLLFGYSSSSLLIRLC